MDESNPIIRAQETGEEFETATSIDTNKEGVPTTGLDAVVNAARGIVTPSQG